MKFAIVGTRNPSISYEEFKEKLGRVSRQMWIRLFPAVLLVLTLSQGVLPKKTAYNSSNICLIIHFTDDGLPLCGTRLSWMTQMRWSPSRPENRKERLTPFGKWSKLVKTSKLLKYDLQR